MSKELVFLSIETSTTNCSVALIKNDEVIDLIEENDGYSHSEKLGVFTQNILANNNMEIDNIAAIAVGVGPGSYTGLRIGVSFVKGLAYANDIPIIKYTSLELLLNQFKIFNTISNTHIIYIPMIDARRDEVYCQIYNSDSIPLTKVYSHVLSESSFHNYYTEKNKIFCFGPGAFKVKNILKAENVLVQEGIVPSAMGVALSIRTKYRENQFENLAYFEPFYLKEFIAGKAKRSMLSPE